MSADVTGQFTAGKRPPIQPKYVVAYETRDQRDARKRAIEVVLSEGEIDLAHAMAQLDPQQDIVNQKGMQGHNYIFLWVRGKNDVSMNATYSATMTQYVDFTGGRFNSDIKTLTADTVAGHVWMSSPAKTMDGDTYSIDVTFSTPITRLPLGTKLAAGGGEPGKALELLFGAIAKKDWDAIQGGVSERALKSFDSIDDAVSTLGIWLPKKVGKITGGELRGEAAILEMEAEMFAGVNGVYLIRMVKRGPKWVFDEASRAGMID
ncbi:MAG TPA: hypothetical protein VH087_07675 [Thermoanaerobaculia bacterium]|nr:hypothetical protein [Thermoanaerobaculia bacterium]